MKLSSVRRLTQAVTFLLFIALFLFTQYPFATRFPLDAILRLDPLVATVAMIGSRAIVTTMLWAGILVVLTFAFGRFFCGYVCPLGTLIDFSDFVFFGKKRRKESVDPKPNRRVKYFVLIGVVAASLLGANFLGFFSPMSIAPRAMTLVVYPPLLWIATGTIDLLRPMLVNMGFDSFTQLDFGRLYFDTGIATLAFFAVIIGANYFRKRFWCRYVCPTGAFLSLFSRFGIVKRKVSDACSDCKLCMSKCDMRAVDTDPRNTILSECTLCGDCGDACKKGSTTFGIAGFGFGKLNAKLNVGRRTFIQSTAAGLLLAATVKAGIQSFKNIQGRFIRPPGSLPESEFLARCIRCGECMKVCKTNTLQPADLETGFEGLWTPHHIMRHAPCEKECCECGHVCPTQAIRALPLEEKKFVKIGTVVIDRHRCIAWEQEKLCLICAEICPFNAIEMRIVDNFRGMFKRPFVIEDKCTGCGYCEKACPVSGRSAIEVYSIGEERIRSGSYITETKKRLREVHDMHEAQYNADLMGSGGASGESPSPSASNPSSSKAPPKPMPVPAEELPKGFSTE
jgi:MauM/NapG family ferredoxin protein